MKITDLRKIVKSKKKAELEELVIKLYKLVPKAKIEMSSIDIEIDANQVYIEAAPQNNSKVEDKLLSDIDFFIGNFLSQNYGIPNRIIPKAKRSKWRFEVMGYMKEIDKLWEKSDQKKEFADIYTELYKALCEGCSFYLVSSEDVFASIRLTQEEFLSKLISRLNQVYAGDELYSKITQLLELNGLSRETTYSDLYWTVTSTFNNPLFLEELYERLWLRYESNKSEYLIKKKKDRHLTNYSLMKKVEGLIIILVSCSDFDKVQQVVHQECHFYDNKKEILYFIVTRILLKPSLKAQKYIFAILDEAKANNIALRSSLLQLHEALKMDINKDLSKVYL